MNPMDFPLSSVRGRRSHTIRETLIWMMVASFLPAWIVMSILIVTVYKGERNRAVQNVVMTARALAETVDRDLASARTAMNVLATAPELAVDDFAGFHLRAGELLRLVPGNNIALTEQSGRQLVNTLVPFGQPLPMRGNRKSLDRVFKTAKPVTTDLFVEPVAKIPLLAVAVPVFRDGTVKYVLTIDLFPERLGDLLIRQELPPTWVAAILDASGMIAARSFRHDQFIGKPGPPALLDAFARQTSGFVETTTQEGIPVFAAFSRSTVSNWSVAIGIPMAEIDQGLYALLGLSCAGAVLVLAVGIGLAGYQSKKIVSAVRSLIAPVMAFGRGEESTAPPSQTREVEEVGRGLQAALHLLQRRTDERDQAERDKDVAERAARLKDEFIGTVSHELRTPLTAITASLGLLEDTEQSDEANELIAIAYSNIQRLGRLVNEILDVEKLEAGKAIFNLQPLEIVSILEQTIQSQRPLARSHGVTLRLENASRFDVRADPDRLIQVFSNLLSNAIKFSPLDADVTVTVEECGHNIQISVRDHGPGIPEDFKSRIFEKFAQADTSVARQKGGTGLGLSIVREIVQRLGGEVGFADAPGGGTVFFVDLPRLQSIDGALAAKRILPCEQDVDSICDELQPQQTETV